MTDKYDTILEILHDYICNRFGYRRPDIDFGLNRNIIWMDRKKVDFYLRFFEGLPHRKIPTIVIARLFFHDTRAGHGSDFLMLITRIAVQFGYEFIELECCNENAKAFGEKLGFDFDSTGQNCCISVSALAQNFKEKGIVAS
ncbi:hypothetical protein [Chryseobacterium populi]|uniref:N-acetyltransferase domain-containing protein n=1 Tax=Chryseobacterium populi TaxID=1144316 RepID=J2KMU5_9FLAO|nr:hypothetical protein [Chryseobacterium populi]EJL74413.1 hypothetical protein PMI13_01152 [Chryseobacterium populi]